MLYLYHEIKHKLYFVKVFNFMYIAINHYFISYKFLPTCIIQFTCTEQLVHYRGIQKLITS